MTQPHILHLVDDTTAGGVMRVIAHITQAPATAGIATHRVVVVDRQSRHIEVPQADIIVSHMAISWRSLPLLLRLRARARRGPLVHVEHSYTEAFVARNVRHKRRFSVLLRLAYGLFSRVIAVSRAQADWLARSGAVTPDRLSVIRSYVDLTEFSALAPPAGPIRVIGAIGRLEPQKGFDTLIAAFRQVKNPDIALHIYGEGGEEQRLRHLAGRDPRIHFMGFTDPATAMSHVDAVAMPSRWEAYGLVAIEARAAGRALLVNDIDGLRDHVSLGAIAVPDTSTAAWQKAIAQLIDPAHPMPELPNAKAARHSTVQQLAQDFETNWNAVISGTQTPRVGPDHSAYYKRNGGGAGT